MKNVASKSKISYHKEKIRSYLKGEKIFPVTLEFDITSQCTRKCKDCPSSRSDFKHDLSMQFTENLFDSFEGQTKGLLMTGGEPTMSPNFGNVLKLARQKGFEEIAVVTNGSLLHESRVINALVEFPSTIRISMYDWEDESFDESFPTLKKIENLRNIIDKSGSPLRIGISVLTSNERAQKLADLSDKVRDAGAHWVYFHPMCTGWDTGKLVQFDQTQVKDKIEEYKNSNLNGFDIYYSKARYENGSVTFSKYHAAHFLMIVGANMKNYLGAEVKYIDEYAICDIAETGIENLFTDQKRLNKINNVNSRNYWAVNSRHRGVLYNEFIDLVIKGDVDIDDYEPENGNGYLFPHII